MRAATGSILLYGPPGTGKTSFASTLAARVGARLRPICEADERGGEPSRSERLAGLRLAQRLATPADTVLLFDEAEDIFVNANPGIGTHTTSSRVFIHRLLERLTVPVIWTANDIEVLGPAVLRRMTMCLELKVPNVATRTLLWRRMGEAEGIALKEADAARLARLVPAAPAVAAASLRATRLVGGDAETARLIVEGIARAVQGGGMPAPEKEPDEIYDPTLVNADQDLAALTADLLRPNAPRAISFLLSGPPGAGKSAWVRHLAGRMGMPVLHKRASDLLDPFDHVLTELQLYGYRPFQDEPDPRPMPDAQIVAGAVADIFDALVVALDDTRLEPDLEDLLWSTVNVFHRAIGRIERELDDNEQAQKRSQREQDGSEIRSVELERLTSEGQTLIERRDSMEFFRDQAADQFERHTHAAWRPRAGSMVNHRTLTSAMIDSRDFLAAKRRAETEVLVPAGPKIAVTGGLDFNDHRLIWDKLDRVHAKHPDMVLLHGGSPKGAERIAAKWADQRKVPQIAFKPDWTRHAKAAPFKRNDAMLEVLPIGVMVFPGTGIQDNLADKAKKLGIPVWKFGGKAA